MMKRWNIMGTLAAALAAILLCAPCARATDQETAAYYKDVEVKVGVITAEAKGIPLIYEMARQSGENHYIIARKAPKLYMQDVVSTDVNSITTDHLQSLYLGHDEVELIRGRRVLIVDDVISTGESLEAIERLVTQVGGNIVGRMAILAEGDAQGRDDIIYLEKLPVFNPDGTIKG